jgi:hypothetical protein
MRGDPTGRRRALGRWIVGLAAVLGGCGGEPESYAEEAPFCRLADAPVDLPMELVESSGAAISRAHPGIVWSHNDSGGEPELFALDGTAAIRARVRLENAENVDWEDLALARCGGASCLYIGDIGDNQARRSSIQIYRIVEPDLDATAVAAERFEFRYPDGPRDAESLFVLPGERIFVVTRGRGSDVAVYTPTSPLTAGMVHDLHRVRTLSTGAVPLPDQVTGADATADGRWTLLRTYTELLVYETDALLGQGEPRRFGIASLGEVQGEAVAVGEDGVIVLTSEGVGGTLPGIMTVLWCSLL